MAIERRTFDKENQGNRQEGGQYILAQVEKNLNELAGEFVEGVGSRNTVLEVKPVARERGDYAFPTFSVSKQLGRDPNDVALELADHIVSNGAGLVKTVQVERGYVNLELEWGELGEKIIEKVLEMGPYYGSENLGKGRRLVIDESSPNIAKPFTVAHLRSTVIGDAMSRIFEFSGFDVIRDNHLGDWGTQFGYLLYAIKEWGDEEVIAGDPIEELQKLYVRANALAEKEPAVGDSARAWFLKLEQGDVEARRLWKMCVDWSMVEFERLYAEDALGIHFDVMLGESFYEPMLKSTVERLRNEGLAVESEDAWVVDLTDKDLGKPLVLKKDGATLYMTRDLAAGIYRIEKMRADGIIYVVGGEQQLYFKQFFEIMRRLGYGKVVDESQHIYFGMMKTEGGKMSTRKGRTVKLEEVLDEARVRIRELIIDKNEGRFSSDEQKTKITNQIAAAALRWFDLKGDPKRGIDFKLEDAVALEGNTGPYMQYSVVRAGSLLKKASELGVLSEGFGDGNYSQDERVLLKMVASFPRAIELAVKEMNPSKVSMHIWELAREFNSYYQKTQLLTAEEGERDRGLMLTRVVGQTLSNGLFLLGIQVPEAM